MVNYMYDCSVNKPPFCKYGIKNYFESVCTGDLTEITQQYTFQTLKNIIDTKGLTNKRIILKIDIEGA